MEVIGQLHSTAALLSENIPLYQLGSRMDRLQTRSGRGGEEKNFQPLPGLETLII
jgi:hypothetical protein